MSVPQLALTDPVGDPGSPLLVLGPSLGTSTILWEHTISLLSEDFRVTAWDLPGHGSTPPAREGFEVADLAAAVAEAIDALGGPAFYAGVSLGGATGLHLALEHSERVSAAAIVCASAVFGTPDAWTDRAGVVRTQGTGALIVGSAQRWFAPESMARDPQLTGRLLHSLRDADDESYALCCEALSRYDITARLGEITPPILAIAGAADPVSPPADAEVIATGVPNGRAVVIDDAGHLAPAEQPRAVVAALREFFLSA